MPNRVLKNKELIPLLNNLAALLRWLRPGKLAVKAARIKAAVEPLAVTFNEQQEKMIDEMCQKDEKGGRKKKPHAYLGGLEIWDFGDREKEFETRNKEMNDAEIEVTFGQLFTETDIEKIEKTERIDKQPKGGNGEFVPAPDFTALLVVIDEDTPAPAAKKADAA